MKLVARRGLPWLVLLTSLLRLAFAFAAVQATRLPAVVADVICSHEGDCDDCDDESDCHCPPGCPKCPYPASHTSSRPPPPPPRPFSTLVALPDEPAAQPRPHGADGPPPDAIRGSVWRPPRVTC